MNQAAGLFKYRGISQGPIEYVFTGAGGRLILMGKMEDGDIRYSHAFVKRFLGFKPLPAPERLIARPIPPPEGSR
jgi:hypothetical protein